jgi:hypothetical protein
VPGLGKGLFIRKAILLAALFLSSVVLPGMPCPTSAAESVGPWRLSSYETDVATTSDGLDITFHGGIDWPNLILVREPEGAAQNTLVVPVVNLSESVEEVFLRLGDDDKASWPEHAIAASARLAPGEHTTLLLPFVAHNARLFGMQVGPPPIGAPAGALRRLDQPNGKIDGAKARALVITLWGQTGERRLHIGTPHFAELGWDGPALEHLIDRYGQATRTNWPERVASDGELLAKSRAALPHADKAPALDPYGGTLAAHGFAATGYFHIEGTSASGYALVTPEGHGLFSLGVNTVAMGDGATYVSGRESMFGELPLPDDRDVNGSGDNRSTNLATREVSFDHGRWVNFYIANLKRLYGQNYLNAWRNETLTRLRSWGFNTIGSWSDPVLSGGNARLPYVLAIALTGNHGHLSTPFDFWGPLSDPFDPRFAADVDASIAAASAKRHDDRFIIGDFVENELPWGDASDGRANHRFALAEAAFALGPTSAAKLALIAQLRARYGDIGAFNAAWGLHVASWEALTSYPPALQDPLGAAARDDLLRFSQALANQYYQTVAEAVHRQDPHHLYLGSRFAAITPEALAACARWCDVVSVNLYSEHFDLARLGAIDKPILVSEFSFGSQDRGPFWAGVVDVGREGARATHYSEFVAAAARDARVIGAHWFQYLDEPASGRLLDGENGHFGMVSVADVPYVTLTDEMRRTNAEASLARESLLFEKP